MRTFPIFTPAGAAGRVVGRKPRWQVDRVQGGLSLPLAAASMLALAGCNPPGPPVPSADPVKTIRVSGVLDASLDVRVFTQYFTAARACRSAESLFRRLDGKTQPRSVWVESEVQRDDEGYVATVALDHFDPGECGWHPFVIAFQVGASDGLSTGRVVVGEDGQHRLKPEPENRIWIDAAAATRGEGRPSGHRQIAPLELACRQHASRGVAVLSCLPEIPRGLALLSEEASEVRVDFSDRTSAAR